MARRRRWGTGTIVPPSTPGGSWAIRYHDAAGARRSEAGFPSRLLAQQALEARRTDLARDRIGLPADLATLPRLGPLGDDWMERRQGTHRGAAKERRVWKKHLRPAFGDLRAPELDLAAVRRYVEGKRAGGLASATVRLQVRLLSSFVEDLRERPRETGATGANPCKGLPRSLAQQLRPSHDARLTPYVERLDDVAGIFAALEEPYRTGYAVGVLAGLRTGEVMALRWEHLDLGRRQIIVQQAVGSSGLVGPVKDNEPRVLPIAPELLTVLAARRLVCGGTGLVVPPARPGRRSGPARAPALTVRSQTLNERLRGALKAVRLTGRDLDWYRATRHTYASHYVQAGGSLHRLAQLLGHSSADVTLRYAHLQPAVVAEADEARLPVRLSAPPAPADSAKDRQKSGRRPRQPARENKRKSLGQ